MLRAFINDALLYGVARFIVGCIAILLLPICTNSLSPDEYGIIDLLTNAGNIISVVVTMEITQGFARSYPEAKNKFDKERYFSTIFWFVSISLGAFLVTAVGFADTWAKLIIGGTGGFWVVSCWAFATLFIGMFQLLQNNLRYSLRPLSFAVTSVSYGVFMVISAIWLLRLTNSGPAGFFVAQAIAASLASGISLWLVRHELHRCFDMPKLSEMLMFSLPLIPSSFAIIGSLFVTRLMINKLISTDELGVYAVAFRVASFVTILIGVFQTALTPLIYTYHTEERTPAQVELLLRWFLALTGVFVLLVGFLAPEIVRLLAPSSYEQAVGIVFPLSLAMVISGLSQFAPGLGIARKSHWIAGISVATLAVNTILCYMLISLGGIYGAALASMGAAAFGLYMSVILGQKLYRIPYHWRRLMAGSCILTFSGLVLASSFVQSASLAWRSVGVSLVAGAMILVLVGGKEALRTVRNSVLRVNK